MWYVAYTLPRCERLVEANMEKLGFEVYYPLILEGFPPKECPLFPRYLLFRSRKLSISPAVVFNIKGVLRLLGYDKGETPLSDDTVEKIKKQVEQIKHRGGVFAPRPGDKIVIRSGIFEGLEGVFLGYKNSKERIRLLLKLVGCRDIPVELPVETVIGKVKLPRRTRGKGRVIRNSLYSS